MSTKKDRIEVRREKVAKRLRECLDMQGMSQSDLLNRTHQKNPELRMARSQLSLTLKGERTLQQDFANAFAKVLNIDAGYLTGDDKFQASDYAFYKSLKDGTYNNFVEHHNKYHLLLDMVDCYYRTIQSDDGFFYDIKHNGQFEQLSEAEMEKLNNEVINYINERIDLICYNHRKER